MLNTRQLQIFRTVAKTGSVTAAGKVLYLTQPAVTKALRLLEERLDLVLFHRQGGRLVATPEALALLPEVERLFGTLDSVEQAATQIRHGVKGHLTIAASSTIAISALSHAIGQFHKTRPQVTVDLRALPTRHVVEYVNTDQADIGVLDVPAPTGSLQIEEFFQAEIVCVMRADHPLAREKTVTPQLLQGHTLVSFGDDTITNWHLREIFRTADCTFQPDFASNSTITAYALASQINGVALVDPFTLLSNAFPHMVARRFRPKLAVQPRFLFSSKPRSLIVSEFVEEVRKTVRGMHQQLQAALNGDAGKPLATAGKAGSAQKRKAVG